MVLISWTLNGEHVIWSAI